MELPAFPRKNWVVGDNELTNNFCSKLLVRNRETCVICLMDENTKKPWYRYRLPCGHITHTRCNRFYLDTQKDYRCCICGPLSKRKQELYYRKVYREIPMILKF